MASHKQFPGNVCKSGNWSRHVSQESNKPYYYNCVSNVSQWEKPREWVDRDLAASIPQTLPLPRQQYVHVVRSDTSSDEEEGSGISFVRDKGQHSVKKQQAQTDTSSDEEEGSDILFVRDKGQHSVKKQQARLYLSSDEEERSDIPFVRDKRQHSVKKQKSAPSCSEGFGGVPNIPYNYNYGRNLASVTPHTLAQTPPTGTQLYNNQLEKWKQEVLKVFPDVELQFLEGRLFYHSGPYAVNHACEELLEMPDYPKSATVEEEKVECGCCCTEHNFEDMVQCTEGHLFCSECLHRLVRGAADGSGKSNLTCMSTNGCQASYPRSVIEKAVPRETLRRYEEKVREENINLAGISNLERCPHCNYAAIIVDEGKSFRCPNKDCMKETCRQCKEDWTNHYGLTCDQVEKDDETKLRKRYEEKMTEAKVRTCHRCKTEFTKEEGCNRMTCNCGATMCYICRAPDIQYNHFCQHPKEPGKRCTQCIACSLWTNPHEDDDRAIKEIKKKARKRRREMGFEKDRSIGVPSQPKAKKCRGQLNN